MRVTQRLCEVDWKRLQSEGLWGRISLPVQLSVLTDAMVLLSALMQLCHRSEKRLCISTLWLEVLKIQFEHIADHDDQRCK